MGFDGNLIVTAGHPTMRLSECINSSLWFRSDWQHQTTQSWLFWRATFGSQQMVVFPTSLRQSIDDGVGVDWGMPLELLFEELSLLGNKLMITSGFNSHHKNQTCWLYPSQSACPWLKSQPVLIQPGFEPSIVLRPSEMVHRLHGMLCSFKLPGQQSAI